MADAATQDPLQCTKRDPRYLVGRRLTKQKSYSSAIDAFAELLEALVNAHGELSPKCALAYFEYGNALLLATEVSVF